MSEIMNSQNRPAKSAGDSEESYEPSLFGPDVFGGSGALGTEGDETVRQQCVATVKETRRERGMVLEWLSGFTVVASKVFGDEGQTAVGRAGTCDVSVPQDKKMSRVHFVIEWKSGYGVLRDLDSTNGTYVNGEPVEEGKVGPGDLITAGTTVFAIRAKEGMA